MSARNELDNYDSISTKKKRHREGNQEITYQNILVSSMLGIVYIRY